MAENASCNDLPETCRMQFKMSDRRQSGRLEAATFGPIAYAIEIWPKARLKLRRSVNRRSSTCLAQSRIIQKKL